jgi:glucose-6-phosphate 1-epimerase
MPAFSADSRVEAILVEELPCLSLQTPHGRALIALQGAQVLHYQPTGQQPVIWLSELAAFKPGQALRGGIPVCWPWFGDLDRNPEAVRAMHDGSGAAPAHGLARAVQWEVVETAGDADQVTALLRLSAPDGLPGWPHAARLELRVTLGTSLALELTTHNLGSKPLTLSQALHSYFSVSDSRAASVDGLDGVDYVDSLQDWKRVRQQGAVTIEGETDRIYVGIDRELIIRDPGWHRSIRLRLRNSRSAVVWNPWVEKAKRLSQFAEDAWQRMLCVETTRAWDDLMVVAPGESGSMAVDIHAQLQS